jgi:hypothetical protein
MFSVELYGRVRHACHVEGLSIREAARRSALYTQEGFHQRPATPVDGRSPTVSKIDAAGEVGGLFGGSQTCARSR